MIESTTNLVNAMNLTPQLEGMTIEYIKLKAFFLGSYAGNVLLAILIGVTIMLFIVETEIIGKYRRFQQVYDDLLKPSTVKLEYNRKELRYTHQNNLDWDGFISVVKKRIKRHPFRYKARGLYEKVDKAVNGHKKCIASINEKICLLVIDGLKKESFDYMIWNGEGDKPLGDYVDMKRIPYSIENIVRGPPLKEEKKEDGRYALQATSTFAKTTSEDKIEKLKKLIQLVADDDEIKKLFTKRDDAERDVEEALKLYNNKLAMVIHDLRLHAGFLT